MHSTHRKKEARRAKEEVCHRPLKPGTSIVHLSIRIYENLFSLVPDARDFADNLVDLNLWYMAHQFDYLEFEHDEAQKYQQ